MPDSDMPDDSITSQAAALQVIQQEVSRLIQWAKGSVSDDQPVPLQLVFDRIHLIQGQPKPNNYRPAWALELEKNEENKESEESEKTPRIPYPQSKTQTEAELDELKQTIHQTVQKLEWQDPFTCQNLSQLTLFLEKFGSHLSFGESDIALIDQAKSEAAIAAALAQNPPDRKLALIGGDLMGVQKFIYTISSEGALKSLRARSFYLELATEEVVQQILTALELPRTNVIYAGASKFYLLVGAIDRLDEKLKEIQTTFNNWLLETFQRKVFLAIAHKTFSADQLQSISSDPTTTPLAQIWQRVNDKLNAQASRKFEHQLDKILEPQSSYQPCKVCHRDDVPEDELKPLNELEELEGDSVLACCTCRQMFRLGDRLPEVKAMVRSSRKYDDDDIPIQSIYYHPIEHFNWKPNSGEVVFQINNWDLKDYPSNQFVPLLLGNYFQTSLETKGFITANEMAEIAEGIKRVGYLRMDVDRLSQIFSKGLGQAYTLPRLASLSRQMTYFFKVYLNSLAEARQPNFIDYCNSHPFERLPRNPPKDPQKAPDKNLRQNLLFIYAGGDDLFISGAWDEVVAFGFDVYQAFRAYAGWHPDITLSGGICIAGAKFPLYQAAKEAGDAEDAAKDNGRDSLSLFGETFKWEHWLGSNRSSMSIDANSRDYLQAEGMPELLGVLPFVKRLLDPQTLESSYPQSFIQNLLITAQLREQKIKETQKSNPAQVKDVTYYLHLPKLAYALSRLPLQIQRDEAFTPVRRSLMSPRNSPYFRAIATWIELLTRETNL